MIDLSVNDSGDTGTLILSGSLTIQHAAQLKETLLEGISSVRRLLINLSDLERADLATIQLLFAAHRTLKEKNKVLDIEGNLPEAWRSAVKDSGYSGCMGENDNSGLWTGEGN